MGGGKTRMLSVAEVKRKEIAEGGRKSKYGGEPRKWSLELAESWWLSGVEAEIIVAAILKKSYGIIRSAHGMKVSLSAVRESSYIQARSESFSPEVNIAE